MGRMVHCRFPIGKKRIYALPNCFIMWEETKTTTLLTPTRGYLTGFTHSLNPYLGCAFGKDSCPYCYVRAMPLQRFASRPWGSWVQAKINAPERLSRELEAMRRNGRFGSLRVFMSSVTDPYQGAEARLRLTRQILEIFLASGPFGKLLLQTRSPLVERDLELLIALGERIVVSLTIETNRDEIRQQLTPTSPSIPRRLLTLERLTAAGVLTQAAISPVLPCDPIPFANLVSSRACRAVVDTLLTGDGAQGRRSIQLGLPGRLAALGYPDWLSSPTPLLLLDALRQRLGTSQVGFGPEGFLLDLPPEKNPPLTPHW
jgi:DNA repair photolyase